MPDVTFVRDVQLGDFRFPFHVTSGERSWTDFEHRMRELNADRFALVTDTGVPPEIVRTTESRLRRIATTTVFTLPGSERTKNLATLDQLAERVVRSGAGRDSVIMALGGGLTGNVAGLLAALLFRGVRLVHVPTTLLAMSDSALSMKQAVNSAIGKNHLGAFHPPTLVWNNLDFLTTLPPEEVKSALCETVKNVLAIVPDRYDELSATLRPDGIYPTRTIVRIIELCLTAKSAVTRRDPHEKREGLVLEYGHTVGHAAELLTGGTLRHGHAVGVGMLVAAEVSRQLGFLDRSDVAAHRLLLERNGTPTVLPATVAVDDIVNVVRHDNKRGHVPARRGMVDMVLLEALGRPLTNDGSLISQVDERLLRSATATCHPFSADGKKLSTQQKAAS